jgi:hypothetical protein
MTAATAAVVSIKVRPQRFYGVESRSKLFLVIRGDPCNQLIEVHDVI